MGIIASIWLGWWLFLRSASAAITWWFAPPRWAGGAGDPGTDGHDERENRTAAIGYYASAPLALTPLSIAAVWAIVQPQTMPLLGRPPWAADSVLMPRAVVAPRLPLLPAW